MEKPTRLRSVYYNITIFKTFNYTTIPDAIVKVECATFSATLTEKQV